MPPARTYHWVPPDLAGKTCLVAGATRGAGRAIAVSLGESGATVYCTGRSTRGKSAMKGRPESIEDTADLVTAAGGKGVAVRCDHGIPEEAASLATQVKNETQGLDLLVNDLWGGDELTEWGKPIWEHSLDKGLTMMRRSLESHLVTAHHLLPLVIARKGLHVEVTDGTDVTNREYRENAFYDLVKTSINRLAFALDSELKPHGAACVGVTPGFMRSEAVLDHFGVKEENWRDAIAKDPFFAGSETPYYVGRAVAHLAADKGVRNMAGRTHASWDMAKRYKFVDRDGGKPDWGQTWKRMSASRRGTQ